MLPGVCKTRNSWHRPGTPPKPTWNPPRTHPKPAWNHPRTRLEPHQPTQNPMNLPRTQPELYELIQNLHGTHLEPIRNLQNLLETLSNLPRTSINLPGIFAGVPWNSTPRVPIRAPRVASEGRWKVQKFIYTHRLLYT